MPYRIYRVTLVLLFIGVSLVAAQTISTAQEAPVLRLTNDPAFDGHPAWSPDGQTIAFISNRGKHTTFGDVWAVNPDGTNVHPLTAVPDFNEFGLATVTWLGSTGDLVVLDTEVFWEYFRVRLSAASSTPIVRTVADGDSPFFERVLFIPGGLGSNSFAVTRDGNAAAWTMLTTPWFACPWHSDFRIAPFSGLNGDSGTALGIPLLQEFSNCASSAGESFRGIAFSPDGSEIVVSRNIDPNLPGFDLEIYTNTGTFVRRLTFNGTDPANPVINYNPSWSSDNRIAFASNSTGRFEIYTINPDGLNQTPVTTNGGDWPSWSPDSSHIAFQSTRDGNSEIYIIPVRGWIRLLGPWTADCDGTFGAIAVHPANSEIVFVGSSHPTAGCGVYKTVDGGRTWVSGNVGIEQLGFFSAKHFPAISDIAISQSNPSFLYAGTFVDSGFATFGTVFTSVDNGDTWHARSVHGGWFSRSPITRPILAISIDPLDPQTAVVGAVGEVIRTVNGGASWDSVLSGRIGLEGTPTDFYALARIAPSKGSRIYVSGFSYYNGPVPPCTLSSQCPSLNGVLPLIPLVSTNGSASWTNFQLPAPGALISDLRIDATNSDVLYAGTSAYFPPLVIPIPGLLPRNWGVFRSTNGGQSWEAINNLLSSDNLGSGGDLSQFPVFQIALDSMFPANLYAVAGTFGVFKSADMGQHWIHLTEVGLPTQTFVRRIIVRGNKIYALTSNGIYSLD